MRKKMIYANFDLKKFKVVDKSGTIQYYDKGDESLDLINADLKNNLHEDLKDAVSVLQELMAKRLGLLDVTDGLISKFKKQSDVLEFALEKEKEQIDRCSVSGVIWKGSGEKKTIQITGSFKGDQYGSTGIATPITRTEEETLGYEKELLEACEAVKKEVFNHAFKGKKAAEPTDNQTSILDENQQEGA